jgi:hypothetical protein
VCVCVCVCALGGRGGCSSRARWASSCVAEGGSCWHVREGGWVGLGVGWGVFYSLGQLTGWLLWQV